MNTQRETILVTGSNGQLGTELRHISANFPNYKFIFTDRISLPIEDEEAVDLFFEINKIDHCINAAAYTAVDKAEEEKGKANHINGTAVGYLAAACKKAGATFIHISTDYVFDGNGTRPYRAEDPVSPVNAYGASKLLGEKLAQENNPSSIIIRTAWVYNASGKNFVRTMMRLMNERSEINVVDDQLGSPTYAADLAEAIMTIITSGKAKEYPGIYSFTNEGIISWFEFAKAIAEIIGSTCKVNPIPTSAYPTPAKRPKYSALDNSTLREIFGVKKINWRKSLEKCLDKMRPDQEQGLV